MTEQQLISKLQELKQIKPRENWVALSKMSILNSSPVVSPQSHWNFSQIFSVFYQRKLAYAFAVFLFLFAGVAGLLKYQTQNTAEVAVKSETNVLAENTLKSNVEDFKVKSQNLAEIVKDKSQSPTVAIKAVKEAATNLTKELQKNPELAKVIALDINNNKPLLDILGGDKLEEVSNLEESIVIQLFKDFDGITLTPSQEDDLIRIKTAFKDGGNSGTALRDMLFLNASQNSNK